MFQLHPKAGLGSGLHPIEAKTLARHRPTLSFRVTERFVRGWDPS